MGRKARERATALALRRRLATEGVIVREARPGEGEAVRRLVLPVDPEHPEMFDSLARMIDSCIQVPTAKGKAIHLVVGNGQGALVAALSAISPFDWLQGTTEIKQPLKDVLARSVVTVEALAVAPAARGMQLGQQLLKRAEELLRAEGCRLLIADFEPSRPHLSSYYTRAGFSLLPEGQALHIGLPGGVILPRESHTDCRTSWKALGGGITVEPGLVIHESSQPPAPVPGGVLVGVLAPNWATMDTRDSS
ncbi:N-acetyltransferase family protein [Streptomyces sp. NPDC054797]